MSVEYKGKIKTIVFGYGDVMSSFRSEDGVGHLRLIHYANGIGKPYGILDISDEDMLKLPLLSNIRFDNIDGIDRLIKSLQLLREYMVIDEVAASIEFPTSK